MVVKKGWLCILICCSLLVSGCWDYNDLEDQNIMILGALDLKDGQRGTMLTGATISGGAVIPNQHPDAKEPSRFDAISGQTISQGREARVGYSTGRYVIGLIQVVLLGRELAENGVDNWISIFSRDPTVKYNLHLAVTKGRADVIARYKTPYFNNTGEQVKLLLEQMAKNGFYIQYDLHQYVIDYISPGKHPVMPILELVDNNKIACVGCAVFKKDKMIAELNTTDMRNIVLLRGQKSRGYIPFVIKDKGKTVDRGAVWVGNKRKVTVTRQDGQLVFNIDIKLRGRALERASHISILDQPEHLQRIEKAVEDEIRFDCYRLVKRMQQEWKIDAIDVSRYALAHWRRDLEKQIDKDVIPNAQFHIKVDCELERIGENT